MNRAAKRYGIIAGNGVLPLTLAQRLLETGFEPHIIGIKGEADPALGKFNFQNLQLEEIAYSVPLFKKNAVTHVVFAGGVRRRPKPTALRVPIELWPDIPAALLALKRGDNGLLAAMVRMFERHGICMVGAHEVLPDHVAAYGVVAGSSPLAAMDVTIRTGVMAANVIGVHDIGQAVVAIGRRVIAVEGLEGTDQMLARIADLRENGRIDTAAKPVLIKLAKPGQELRTDMPVIGPATIEGCRKAGIALICVSANSTLIMDVERTINQAKMSRIDIIGINPDDWTPLPS